MAVRQVSFSSSAAAGLVGPLTGKPLVKPNDAFAVFSSRCWTAFDVAP
jgi:hypothetical protein